jgi:hypothetical protein
MGQTDSEGVSKVLEVLTQTPATAESREIHRTILEICSPSLKLALNSSGSQHGVPSAINTILQASQTFNFALERQTNINDMVSTEKMQQDLIALLASTSGLGIAGDVGHHDIAALTTRVLEAYGADALVSSLLEVLLQLSEGHQFAFALDAATTLVCITGSAVQDVLRVRYQAIGTLLKTGNTLGAEAVIRLHRHVEAYAGLLAVPDMGMDTFSFNQQLANIDTADPDLDAVAAITTTLDLPVEQPQADSIDQVLDEAAAMTSLDNNDADLSFDALYGLEGNDMDLNDLDLDMF